MDVVPLDVLLEAMTTDCSAVSARIQRVLLPSYFPGEVPGLLEVGACTENGGNRTAVSRSLFSQTCCSCTAAAPARGCMSCPAAVASRQSAQPQEPGAM